MHFFRRARKERELDEELRFYVDALAETKMREGLSPEEARRAALIQFGGIEQVKEQVRDARRGAWLDSVAQDLRYAVRGLSNSPGFAIAVILSLAAGIGANSALFSVINAVMLRPLPVEHPEQLYSLEVSGPGRGLRSAALFSYPLFEQMRTLAQKNGDEIAAMSRIARVHSLVDGDREMENAFVQLVSGEFFSLDGLRPARGRLFTSNDNKTVGAHPVAVISYEFWQRRLGRSPDVIGRGMNLNGAHFTIIGVAPPGFTGMWLESPAEIWVPVMMQSQVHYAQNFNASNSDLDKPWPPQLGINWLNLTVRTRSGAPALRLVFDRWVAGQADHIGNLQQRRNFLQNRLVLQPMARGLSDIRQRYTAPLLALMSMVAIVLLIACANTANLLLARAERRQREMAVRLSLGAGRGRIIRQSLTESLLLALIAAVAGLVLGNITSQLLVRRALGVISGPSPFSTRIDARVLGFTIAMSVLTTLLFGLAPAFRATRVNLESALRAASRTVRDGTRFHLQKLLVAVQIALTLILVTGTMWLAGSLRNLVRVHLGYDQDHIVTVAFNSEGYSQEQLPALYDRIVQAVEALPGVRSASVAACGLVSGCRSTADVQFEGYQPNPGEQVRVQQNFVGPGYFATVGTRLLAGRDFTGRENRKMPFVALVNQAVANRYFPGGHAIGKKFGYDKPDAEIIGIVEDARVNSVRESPPFMVYYAIRQTLVFGYSFEVRVAGDPASRIPDIRRAFTQIDRNLPIDSITTLSAQVNDDLRQDWLIFWLTSALGTLALGLGCFGLYGVMSYTVARRTGELGIRMALGAPRSRVFATVFGESLTLIALGLVIGLPFVLAASRVVAGMLFDVNVANPIPIAAAALALATATAIAAYVPARRAARVEPMTPLRYE